MAQYYPSITSDSRTEAFELQVARGLVAGHRPVTIFGYNPNIATESETIWPHGGIIPLPATATALKVSSTSVDDAAAGTGARSVLVVGLDANHIEIQEVVTLNGQTEVTTTQAFLRVNYAAVATAGSANAALGTIYIGTGVVTAGVPATVYQVIPPGDNATVTGHYTVPADHTAYILSGSISTGQTVGAHQVVCRLLTISSDNIRRTAAIVALAAGSADYDFLAPIVVHGKTDIETRAIGSTTNHHVSSFLNIILVKGENAQGFGVPRY